MTESFFRVLGFFIVAVTCLAVIGGLFVVYDGARPSDLPMIMGGAFGVFIAGLVVGCLLLAIADVLAHLRAIRDEIRASNFR